MTPGAINPGKETGVLLDFPRSILHSAFEKRSENRRVGRKGKTLKHSVSNFAKPGEERGGRARAETGREIGKTLFSETDQRRKWLGVSSFALVAAKVTASAKTQPK